jgi:hypothetical protein
MAPTLHALIRLGIGRTVAALMGTGCLVRYRLGASDESIQPAKPATFASVASKVPIRTPLADIALGSLSETALRQLIDRTYRKLDRPDPGPGLREQYYKLVEELDSRLQAAPSHRGYPKPPAWS